MVCFLKRSNGLGSRIYACSITFYEAAPAEVIRAYSRRVNDELKVSGRCCSVFPSVSDGTSLSLSLSRSLGEIRTWLIMCVRNEIGRNSVLEGFLRNRQRESAKRPRRVCVHFGATESHNERVEVKSGLPINTIVHAAE